MVPLAHSGHSTDSEETVIPRLVRGDDRNAVHMPEPHHCHCSGSETEEPLHAARRNPHRRCPLTGHASRAHRASMLQHRESACDIRKLGVDQVANRFGISAEHINAGGRTVAIAARTSEFRSVFPRRTVPANVPFIGLPADTCQQRCIEFSFGQELRRAWISCIGHGASPRSPVED